MSRQTELFPQAGEHGAFATLDEFAAVCDRVAATNSRTRKVALLGGYLRGLADDDLARAALYLTGSAFPRHDPRRLSAGHATMRDAAMAVTGWDLEITRLSLREVGDTAEGIALLLVGHGENLPFTLADAEGDFERLEQARRTADKRAILEARFRTAAPPAIKYFLKVITGELRIGLQEKQVEEAIAAATGMPKQAVRDANNRAGDIARVALAARHGTLAAIEATLFHPMDFMLAKPLDSLDELTEPDRWILEDKFDGIRAQAHYDAGRVQIFSRGLEEVTDTFPELTEAFATLPGSGVIDGEILGWQHERALPFVFFQQRLARKKVTEQMLRDVPVAFVAYDLLYRDGRLLFDVPLEDRRRELEAVFAGRRPPLLLAEQRTAASVDEVDGIFHEARGRANEGLVLKQRGSAYEPGKRSGAWRKLKRPFGTLDVVVTAAEQGHGKRATVLSDYTFAVRDGDRFVNVGKAYSGLTDEEIRELTRVFRKLAIQRFGRVLVVEPQVVLEVAFDGVQKSARHKSGYALRFPRILRWRKDKTPEEIDTRARVEELYAHSMRVLAEAASAPPESP